MNKKNAVRRMLAVAVVAVVAVVVVAAGGVQAHVAEAGPVSRFHLVEVAPAQE